MAASPPEHLPPPERSAEEVRSTAEEILARPEFRDDQSLYDRVLGWLGERLAEILGVLAGGGRGALIGWALLLAAAAAVVYLVVRIVRDGAVGRVRRDRPGAAVTVQGARRPATEWRAEADAHAAAGRWRDAVRCRWRAVVADLVERGRVEEVPGLTAGDYRAMVASAAPGAAPAFSDATDIFELAWYGGAEVAAGDHDRLVAAAASVGSSLDDGPGRPRPAADGGDRR